MPINLSTQYDALAARFSALHHAGNEESNQVFFGHLDSVIPRGSRILDLGCGNGADMAYYARRFSGEIVGVDASAELLVEARASELSVELGTFDAIPLPDASFDIVVSKYALQTTIDLQETYPEIARVLRPGGKLAYLTVHPLRQFFEKKTPHKDYFEQTIVDSILFDGALTVQEPTHTLQEYLSEGFFQVFELNTLIEAADFVSAERIGDMHYPTYLIVSATKR